MTVLKKIVGSFFRGKIHRLEASFAAACKPFNDEIENVERAVARHQVEVAAGRAVWDEVTDDGHHYSYGEHFGEQRDEAEDALLTLRKAFCFLIYHQWERTVQRWTTKKHPNHVDLIAGAKAEGVALDEPGLDVLRLLVNTLKHNSDKCGSNLFTLRPDLFRTGFNPSALSPVTGLPMKSIDWAAEIVITDANVASFFKTVSDSAPR